MLPLKCTRAGAFTWLLHFVLAASESDVQPKARTSASKRYGIDLFILTS